LLTQAKWFVASFLLAAVAGAMAQEVIPDFYRDPGLNPNRSYVNQSFNEHIDPFTGSLQQHYVDLHIPGNGGFDLKVVRSYNSASVDPFFPSDYASRSGVGWEIHFGRVLKSDNSICFNGNVTGALDNPVVRNAGWQPPVAGVYRQCITIDAHNTALACRVQFE
jgi:hypothetical protein